MTKVSIKMANRLIRETNPTVLWSVATMCDSHGIIDPAALIAAGLPAKVTTYFTETLKSDGTHIGTIFVDGKPVDELAGVYGLRLLEGIAGALGVTYQSFMGRGEQARAIQAALRVHFKIEDEPRP